MAAKPLWPEWPVLERRIRRAVRLPLFIDLDGTLTPIVEHPSKTKVSSSVRKLLRELSRRPGIWIAIVSGRKLSDLKKKIGISGLCYVGNHGLEIQGVKLRHINPVAAKSRPLLRTIRRQLAKILKPIPGAWVEDKGLTLSVHFRGVSEKDHVLVKNAFHEVVAPYRLKNQVHLTDGKQVFEVRPPAHWNKGSVVLWLLARQTALASAGEVLPFYVGDDFTDEDAFRALEEKGITVAVGPSTPLTQARYVVQSSDEVEALLRKILEIREGAATRPGTSRPRARRRSAAS